LGRKTKNTFEDTSLYTEKDAIPFTLYSVKIPFVYSITVKIKDPNLHPATTTWEYHILPENVENTVKEIEKQYLVLKVEQSTRPMIDMCPQCNRKGIPKIEKKDNKDYRTRVWKNKESGKNTLKEKPVEYWLTYDHKSKPKKCRIVQYENTPHPAYKKSKRKNIDISRYFFPMVMEDLQSGSLKFRDNDKK